MPRRALPHLRLLPWAEDFLDPFARLAADPRVMTYVGDGSPWKRDKTAERHARCLDHWRRHGFGWRGIVDADSGTFLGIAAANYLRTPVLDVDTSAVEIGWWVDPDHWGRGIASRGARMVRDETFSQLDVAVVVARLHRDNIGSAKVATNTGLTYRGDFTAEYDVPAHLYALNRTDWNPRGSPSPPS